MDTPSIISIQQDDVQQMDQPKADLMYSELEVYNWANSLLIDAENLFMP